MRVLRVKRTHRGWCLSGRRRFVTVKWLHPGTRAIKAGLWRWQCGRLLIRVSRTLVGLEEHRERQVRR